jgi:tetratricopeptide (TPR) repeat protein
MPFLARRVKSEFERAVALDPRSVQARQGLLQFYVVAPGFMGGGMERAREQAAALAAFNPMQGHLASAFIAQRMKDTATVLREYEAAITASPDSAAGYLALGGAYQQMARWPEAFATYERLLRRRPADMMAQFQLGRTAALSGQRLERGEQALRLWLSRIPTDARTVTIAGAHHRLGQILEQTGRSDAARTEFAEALRINPKNDEARKSLAALK